MMNMSATGTSPRFSVDHASSLVLVSAVGDRLAETMAVVAGHHLRLSSPQQLRVVRGR